MPIIKMLHTIRYLKARQVAGQIRNRLRPFWERPERFFQMDVPDFPGCCWGTGISFLPPGAQGNAAGSIKAGNFEFVNRGEALGWPPADWDVSELPKLWQYNLHYFEWLWALDYESIREVILDWIERHPLQKGAVGWEPYPTSLRVMNWCAVCFGKFREQTEADAEFVAQLWGSIFLQAQWLSRHLETHLLGNHLFENGAALAVVGSCFSGDAARGWCDKGVEILKRECPEQILTDGMHFERSPMYHLRMTYLIRLLLDTDNAGLTALLTTTLPQMQLALAHLCHPDGQIALFNDSAFSIYNDPADLVEPGKPGAWALPDAGYYGFRAEDGAYIICDAGSVGPDYIPGHAHGDIFSFELSLRGHRVIVDSGVYDYVPGDMRRYCRSTCGHNTVEIDGQSQCEFWSAFRVARRAYPHDIQWKPSANGFQLKGWHDGYRRLPGKPTHRRGIVWDANTGLTVTDSTTASCSIRTVSRLHLHPSCHIMRQESRELHVEYPNGTFVITFEGGGTLSCEQSFYCPEFGQKETNTVLLFTTEGKESETSFTVVSQ